MTWKLVQTRLKKMLITNKNKNKTYLLVTKEKKHNFTMKRSGSHNLNPAIKVAINSGTIRHLCTL